MNNFDIFTQIGTEIEQFNNDRVHIAGTQADSARYLTRKSKGYDFSQKETLNLIDLYYNSKFETGNTDSEGQRKLFLNICAFRADVASKMIDLDTKNFIFIPDDEDSQWGSFLISKEFKNWARKNYFGDLLNEAVENWPKYGTLVIKRVGKKLERVPLKTLVNQQDAKDLQTATHVIEIHENMTLQDMKKFPDWDTDQLEMKFGDKATVYERYGHIPASLYYELQGKKAPKGLENESYDCVVICTCQKSKDGKFAGSILFIEKIDERPYLEVHWKKQDGRWLGIGEVENQFENQVARNMIANFRKRALQWSSKKIFQSPDETVAKNLIRDVKDGEVLRIMPNGNITQIDMASREVGEFQSFEDVLEKNSDQKSFTYEVATGESMPSGTPFRLGVVLSNAVNSHFGLKQEKLGLFFKKVVIEFVFDIFKKENRKEHTVTFYGSEKGVEDIRKAMLEHTMKDKIKSYLLNPGNRPMPVWSEVKTLLEEAYKQKSHLYIDVPDSFYDNMKNHCELVITGEEIDIPSKLGTFSTLYQTLVQVGDPRSEQVLNKIMQLTGENLEAIVGKPQQMNQQISPVQQQAPGFGPQQKPNEQQL
jgi:hypothetical protein